MKTVVLLILFIFASGHLAKAQQPKKVQKIGLLLGGGLPHASSGIQALREGLRQFGYIEGQNIALENRGMDGQHSVISVTP